MIYNREAALAYLHQNVHSESLRKHCLAVEAGMWGYGLKLGLDEESLESWRVLGLLHDIDFEAHPDQHPLVGLGWLKEAGYPEDFVDAVWGHAQDDPLARKSLMAKALFAVDELSSFIVAVALMRPEGFEGLGFKSVNKKLKDKAFARAVDRDGIRLGAEALALPLNELVEAVIQGLVAQEAQLKAQGMSLL